MILPHHISSVLSSAIQREQECQQRVALLEHESMVVDAGRADADDIPHLAEELALARAEWNEALQERRRLEEAQLLASEMDRLRERVRAERSAMSRWARWREARSFRREVG